MSQRDSRWEYGRVGVRVVPVSTFLHRSASEKRRSTSLILVFSSFTETGPCETFNLRLDPPVVRLSDRNYTSVPPTWTRSTRSTRPRRGRVAKVNPTHLSLNQNSCTPFGQTKTRRAEFRCRTCTVLTRPPWGITSPRVVLYISRKALLTLVSLSS